MGNQICLAENSSHSQKHEWSKCAEFKSLSTRSQGYLDRFELEDTREEVIQLLKVPNDEHEPSWAAASTENANDEAENEQNNNDNVEDDQSSATSNCLLSSLQVRDKHMPLNVS